MRIAELLAHGRTFSFEFFPPKTDEAQAQLATTIAELAPLKPSFFSVTYGALGSTRSRTRDVVVELARSGTVPPMAHLTCVGHTRSDIDLLLGEYKAAGVENILALGGDLPEDPSTLGPSEFNYALDLVEHLRANFDVSIGVAAHPEVHPRSPSRDSDRKHLAEKLRRADFAMTQFFFEVGHYTRLVDELAALGVHKPIVPGIMPVTNKGQIVRMRRCRARILVGSPTASPSSTTRQMCVASASRSPRNSATNCSRLAHQGCTSTRSTEVRRRARFTPTSVLSAGDATPPMTQRTV